MKLEIRCEIHPINPMELEVQGAPPRAVYIDGKRCPPTLERIILAGLDNQMMEYYEIVEKAMYSALKDGK